MWLLGVDYYVHHTHSGVNPSRYPIGGAHGFVFVQNTRCQPPGPGELALGIGARQQPYLGAGLGETERAAGIGAMGHGLAAVEKADIGEKALL